MGEQMIFLRLRSGKVLSPDGLPVAARNMFFDGITGKRVFFHHGNPLLGAGAGPKAPQTIDGSGLWLKSSLQQMSEMRPRHSENWVLSAFPIAHTMLREFRAGHATEIDELAKISNHPKNPLFEEAVYVRKLLNEAAWDQGIGLPNYVSDKKTHEQHTGQGPEPDGFVRKLADEFAKDEKKAIGEFFLNFKMQKHGQAAILLALFDFAAEKQAHMAFFNAAMGIFARAAGMKQIMERIKARDPELGLFIDDLTKDLKARNPDFGKSKISLAAGDQK